MRNLTLKDYRTILNSTPLVTDDYELNPEALGLLRQRDAPDKTLFQSYLLETLLHNPEISPQDAAEALVLRLHTDLVYTEIAERDLVHQQAHRVNMPLAAILAERYNLELNDLLSTAGISASEYRMRRRQTGDYPNGLTQPAYMQNAMLRHIALEGSALHR